MIELKSCPFCGGKAELTDYQIAYESEARISVNLAVLLLLLHALLETRLTE